MRERKYDDAGFTSKERLRERQSLAMKELLIELRRFKYDRSARYNYNKTRVVE